MQYIFRVSIVVFAGHRVGSPHRLLVSFERSKASSRMNCKSDSCLASALPLWKGSGKPGAYNKSS